MRKLIPGAAFMLMFGLGAVGAIEPRHTTVLENFAAGNKADKDTIRMRITIAGDAQQPERNVRIGDILLCSRSACYRARTSGFVAVESTYRGVADVLADVKLPFTTVTDIYFTDVAGMSTVHGHLKLETPLTVEKGFQGLELMIAVRRLALPGRTRYVPTGAASMYFHPDGHVVRYLPTVRTGAALPFGATLIIPAGALAKPQVFHIGVSDTGDLFPMIDIYPYIKLRKAATVQAMAFAGRSSSRGQMVVPAAIGPAEGMAVPAQLDASRTARISLMQTMLVRPGALEGF